MYWFPKLKNLDIPQPRTRVVLITKEELKHVYNETMPRSLTQKVQNVIGDSFKLPIFLRTDQSSAKHYWVDSCYYDGSKKLWTHLIELASFNLCAGLFGLPFKYFVIREYIPMDSLFVAFHGNMPVSAEERYFVKDGKVLCRHHYWFKECIEPGLKKALPADWESLLEKTNVRTDDEIALLDFCAEKVAAIFNGFWSIDFCRAKTGKWYLIDMALGAESYHHKGCKNIKIKE